jgi:hypothetical protein
MKNIDLDDMTILEAISKEGCTKNLECRHLFLWKTVLKFQNAHKVRHFEQQCDCYLLNMVLF